jgi:Ni,Fe-hydrogenase III large subunit
MVLSLGLERMISSLQHLRLQSIEVGSEACLVHLARVKGFVKSSLKCTGRRGTRGLMLMM